MYNFNLKSHVTSIDCGSPSSCDSWMMLDKNKSTDKSASVLTFLNHNFPTKILRTKRKRRMKMLELSNDIVKYRTSSLSSSSSLVFVNDDDDDSGSKTLKSSTRILLNENNKCHLLLHHLFFMAILLATFNLTNGLKIIQYSIPRMVDATNISVVTLDCVYSYDPGDVKLVVRWFHNDSPEPIYQWIPEPDIRYVGELIRPYFDMNFTVSSDRYSKYRALRLDLQTNELKVPVALSGNYSCVISSIANQDSRQSQMIVYVPPKIFEFHFIELNAERIALECIVQGVYPKPLLTYSEQYSSNYTHLYRSPSVNVSLSFSDPDSYLYSASFLHPINTVLKAGNIYECRLQLPGTSYVRKKRIKIIFPTSYVTKSGQQTQHPNGTTGQTGVPIEAQRMIAVMTAVQIALLIQRRYS